MGKEKKISKLMKRAKTLENLKEKIRVLDEAQVVLEKALRALKKLKKTDATKKLTKKLVKAKKDLQLRKKLVAQLMKEKLKNEKSSFPLWHLGYIIPLGLLLIAGLVG